MGELATYLIVCPLVFLAGFVDSIGGGGGLISLPAYVLAGLPMHTCVATNKLSSVVGTSVSTARFLKNSKPDWLLALPSIGLALCGSAVGAQLSLIVAEEILRWILLFVLPVVAFFVLKKDSFTAENTGAVSKLSQLSRRRQRTVAWCAAFLIGMYDGFYGPGTGTFLMIVFIQLAKMTTMEAALNTKLVNLSSNLAAVTTFLLSGQVNIPLGLAAAVFSVAGNYIGSGLVMKNGLKIVKPVILVVLALLFVKLIFGL